MTCQRCDASAVPRSVTVGPYGSAVWWLAKLYSSSYGHHGLSPCSTDIGQGALQVLWSVGPVTATEITGRGRGHVHRGDRCGHRLPTGVVKSNPAAHSMNSWSTCLRASSNIALHHVQAIAKP